MLLSLSVRDYALIEAADLEVGSGFTAVTGETGAGKSILAGALGAILGTRTSSDDIRSGTEKAIIEARVLMPNDHAAIKLMEEVGGEGDEGVWLLRREIHTSGRSRAWIGGAQATVSQLKAVGDRLVDFHGQHDHQLLLSPDEHTAILDGFGWHTRQLADVAKAHTSAQDALRELVSLETAKRDLSEKRELADFQLAELDEIDPQSGEWGELESERKRLEGVEQLSGLLSGLTQLLSEDEQAVVVQIGQAQTHLSDAVDIDDTLSARAADLEQISILISDLSLGLADYMASLEVDPHRLEQVHDRLDDLRRLTRKYGSIDEALTQHARLKEGVDDEADLDLKIEEARSRSDLAQSQFSLSCARLSDAREKASQKLSRQVSKSLGTLGMSNALMSVRLDRQTAGDESVVAATVGAKQYLAGPTGVESIEFFFTANRGEPERPLARVASGGEVSRIMLAIKSVIAHTDPVLTMVFDEIDNGVSGRIADRVGQRMKELAEHRQILSITHLPQIASLADHHLEVRKKIGGGRTVTTVETLGGEARTNALAALIGGDKITDTALEHARAMLEDA